MKTLQCLLIISTITTNLFSQNNFTPCGNPAREAHLERTIPNYRQQLQAAQQIISQPSISHSIDKTNPRIIPVVFHVIHLGGSENISEAQIVDQIRIMNEDFRNINPNSVNTPSYFNNLSGDANIEFRLATKDPNGNCTNGITRHYSPLTDHDYALESDLKAVEQWNSNKYFNVWVVRRAVLDGQSLGGYATFPGFGSPSLDGVVMAQDCIGSIGTAAGNADRNAHTLTHEAGHWLGLRHIWGDQECGDDNINDTPVHKEPNLGRCPTYPLLNNCPGGDIVHGEMFMNYMDYTNNNCMSMFSNGQAGLMNSTLDFSRANLWSSNNLSFTGVSFGNTNQANCPPVADFITYNTVVCMGKIVSFVDLSYNGRITARTWSCPNATISNPNDSVANIVFTAAGTFPVTLAVTNAQGTTTTTKSLITVLPITAQYTQAPYLQGFEDPAAAFNDWTVKVNGNQTWQSYNQAGYNSGKCVYINNYSRGCGPADEMVSPTFSLAGIQSPKIAFRLAYRQQSQTNTDNLQIYTTKDCGETWNLRYNVSGNDLASITFPSNAPFVPSNSNDWKPQTVNFSSSYVDEPNVQVKFVYQCSGGNNIYLDDINIVGTNFTAIEEVNNNLVSYYFDEANQSVQISAKTPQNNLKITLYNLTGQLITTQEIKQQASVWSIPVPAITSGIYFMQIQVENNTPSILKIVK